MGIKNEKRIETNGRLNTQQTWITRVHSNQHNEVDSGSFVHTFKSVQVYENGWKILLGAYIHTIIAICIFLGFQEITSTWTTCFSFYCIAFSVSFLFVFFFLFVYSFRALKIHVACFKCIAALRIFCILYILYLFCARHSASEPFTRKILLILHLFSFKFFSDFCVAPRLWAAHSRHVQCFVQLFV